MYDIVGYKKTSWLDEKILKAFGISIVVLALAMPIVLLILNAIMTYLKPLM